MWTAYARVASVVENALGINFHAFVACVTLVIALTYPKLAKSVSDRLDSRAMNDRERLERYQRNRQRALEKRGRVETRGERNQRRKGGIGPRGGGGGKIGRNRRQGCAIGVAGDGALVVASSRRSPIKV